MKLKNTSLETCIRAALVRILGVTSSWLGEKASMLSQSHNAQISKGVGIPAAQSNYLGEGGLSSNEDTHLLNWLRDNVCDLRCVPTADDDYDWVVIEHHMERPYEREVGRGFSTDPRDAIRAAVSNTAGAA